MVGISCVSLCSWNSLNETEFRGEDCLLFWDAHLCCCCVHSDSMTGWTELYRSLRKKLLVFLISYFLLLCLTAKQKAASVCGQILHRLQKKDQGTVSIVFTDSFF